MTAYLSEIIHATEKISEGQDLAWKELRYVYPLELKGFLYEKILSAYAQKIRMQIQVDEKLDFKCSYMKDVIRILGIFIDNAIEETRNIENGYIIIVAMNTEQGCLFSIANNYKKKTSPVTDAATGLYDKRRKPWHGIVLGRRDDKEARSYT